MFASLRRRLYWPLISARRSWLGSVSCRHDPSSSCRSGVLADLVGLVLSSCLRWATEGRRPRARQTALVHAVAVRVEDGAKGSHAATRDPFRVGRSPSIGHVAGLAIQRLERLRSPPPAVGRGFGTAVVGSRYDHGLSSGPWADTDRAGCSRRIASSGGGAAGHPHGARAPELSAVRPAGPSRDPPRARVGEKVRGGNALGARRS